MKIEETKNGNIKIVMRPRLAKALYILLNQLEHDEIYRAFGPGNAVQAQYIIELWESLLSNKHLYA